MDSSVNSGCPFETKVPFVFLEANMMKPVHETSEAGLVYVSRPPPFTDAVRQIQTWVLSTRCMEGFAICERASPSEGDA